MLLLMKPGSLSVYEVRCRACGRLVGLAPSKAYIFCPLPECAIESEPIFDNEERDALIEVLSLHGLTDHEIGTLFDITRARVQQVASSRAVPYYERSVRA